MSIMGREMYIELLNWDQLDRLELCLLSLLEWLHWSGINTHLIVGCMKPSVSQHYQAETFMACFLESPSKCSCLFYQFSVRNQRQANETASVDVLHALFGPSPDVQFMILIQGRVVNSQWWTRWSQWSLGLPSVTADIWFYVTVNMDCTVRCRWWLTACWCWWQEPYVPGQVNLGGLT